MLCTAQGRVIHNLAGEAILALKDGRQVALAEGDVQGLAYREGDVRYHQPWAE